MSPEQHLSNSVRVLALLLALATTSGVRANIFGADDRLPVVSREYPWRCVGLVVSQTTTGVSTGTGFLIGRNLVLTNAHVVVDEETEQAASELQFQANRIDGVPSHTARVTRVWLGSGSTDRADRQDWAVLQLDSAVGDELGWLPLSPEPADRGVLVGYSGDYRNQETAGISPCTIHPSTSDILHHDADARGGSSGGPIIARVGGQPMVVAVNFAEFREHDSRLMFLRDYSDEYSNLAVPVAAFMDEVEEIVAGAER